MSDGTLECEFVGNKFAPNSGSVPHWAKPEHSNALGKVNRVEEEDAAKVFSEVNRDTLLSYDYMRRLGYADQADQEATMKKLGSR